MGKIKLASLALILFLCLSGKSYGDPQTFQCLGMELEYCKNGDTVLCSEDFRKHRPDLCGLEEKPEIQPSPKCLHFFNPNSALGRNFVGVNLCSSEEERQSLLLWVKYLKELALEK